MGKKRIGLAVSDELGIAARGINTLYRTRIRQDLEDLKRICDDMEIKLLLVGRPLHMSGDESKQSEYTRTFAERLGQYVSLPLVYWDERLSSKEAERLLRAAGASLEQKKKTVDQLSAVLILESYLGFRQIAQQDLSA